jgi:hypothetical protein
MPENKVNCNKFLLILFNKKPGKLGEVPHPFWASGRPPFQGYREFSENTPTLFFEL